jgi:glycosyltransferase involved in cell wall biosynthesis
MVAPRTWSRPAVTISVIIPTYNRATLLAVTLRSVLAQSRVPEEIIVVDDGSTDETSEVVSAVGPAVRYHHQAHAHLSAARNAGQALATGDALLFLDSDDVLRPGALAALESALTGEPEAALAYCRSQTIDAEGRVIEPAWPQDDHEGEVWERLVEANFIRSAGCVLLRRSRVTEAPAWDVSLRAVEDWDLWLRLADRAPVVRVEAPFFQYRRHAGNMSRNTARMHCETFKVFQKQLRLHRHRPERIAHLLRGPRRPYGDPANLDFVEGRALLSEGRSGQAWPLLLRAARRRPSLVVHRPWIASMVRCLVQRRPARPLRPAPLETPRS